MRFEWFGERSEPLDARNLRRRGGVGGLVEGEGRG